MKEPEVKITFEWIGKTYDGFGLDFERFKELVIKVLEVRNFEVVRLGPHEFLISGVKP